MKHHFANLFLAAVFCSIACATNGAQAAPCTSDEECEPFETCHASTKLRCPEGRPTCQDGETDEECVDAVQQWQEEHCTDREESYCTRDWQLPCSSASDCGDGFECVDSDCIYDDERTCETADDCPQYFTCAPIVGRADRCMPPQGKIEPGTGVLHDGSGGQATDSNEGAESEDDGTGGAAVGGQRPSEGSSEEQAPETTTATCSVGTTAYATGHASLPSRPLVGWGILAGIALAFRRRIAHVPKSVRGTGNGGPGLANK